MISGNSVEEGLGEEMGEITGPMELYHKVNKKFKKKNSK